MATHRPLVVVDGAVQQLPVGDAVVGASGGSASASGKGWFIVDFGDHPGSNTTMATVSGQTGIQDSTPVFFTVSMDDATVSHTPNDHRYLPLLCTFTTQYQATDVGFDVRATSLHKLTGQFMVRYSWSA